MRHVHYVSEDWTEKTKAVKNKYFAYMEYHSLKRRFDEVRVTDNEWEYCDESEL